MRLVSFNRAYSENRDALSIYFELEYNNIIKIHKTYYEYDEFINYLRNQNNVYQSDYPNVKDSEKEVDFESFCNFLISDKKIQKLSFYYDILKLIDQTRNNRVKDSIEYRNIIENTIEEINSYFYGCTFFINGEINEKDDSVDIIDEKFNIVYPNERNRYDRIVEPSLDNIYADIDNLKLVYRVYDVGQANCSAILSFNEENDYKVVCVFDLGCERRKRKNAALNDMLNKIDASTTIIISHFDSDHYNLIQNKQLPPTVRWLFSSTAPTSKKGSKIFQLLLTLATQKSRTGNIYYYNAPYQLSNYLRIEEKQDNNKDLYQSTVLNANSVISIIETEKNNILIPGDALYHDFPQGVYNTNYTVVLVPHHCCYYPDPSQMDPYTEKLKELVNNNPIGIVQCGNNTYGHANISHLNWYKKYCICNNGKIYDDNKKIINKFGNSNNKYIDFDL